MAGNQIGKTLAGGFEAAIHATGRYPPDWKGRRFDRPTIGWACGICGEVVRDTVQRVLVGRSGIIGTGAIPQKLAKKLMRFEAAIDEARKGDYKGLNVEYNVDSGTNPTNVSAADIVSGRSR
jgi:hypothetical protein